MNKCKFNPGSRVVHKESGVIGTVIEPSQIGFSHWDVQWDDGVYGRTYHSDMEPVREDISVSGFVVSDSYVDESVGVFLRSWKVEGDFDFSNDVELEEFRAKLSEAFELQCGGEPVVSTIEEVEESKRLEEEMWDKIHREVCPDCGNFGIIRDEDGIERTCYCHY